MYRNNRKRRVQNNKIKKHKFGKWCKRNFGVGGKPIFLCILLLTLCILMILELNTRAKEKKLQECLRQSKFLEEQIKDEEFEKEKLQEKHKLIGSKMYTIEKAREIYGLSMPDEIIVKPKEY